MSDIRWCAACGKWRVLDAFAGEGGATRGLMDAGFCVTAVDNDKNRLKRNPAQHKVLVDDAVAYIVAHGGEFVFVWTSPPCQDYSIGTASMRAQGRVTGHLRLIAVTRQALQLHDVLYVIENVELAKSEMDDPITLCARMFELEAFDADGEPLVMDRHRVFESNFAIDVPHHPSHDTDTRDVAGVYGGSRRVQRERFDTLATLAPRDRYAAKHIRKGGYVPRSASVQSELLGGVDWMTLEGRKLCIPPVYAQHICKSLVRELFTKGI